MTVRAAIDIETLDLEPTAVVLSIGVALFTLADGVIDTRYYVLDKESQHACGRTTRESTLQWWREQSPEARAVLDAAGVPVPVALTDLAAFLAGNSVIEVWGYGSDFDNVTVSSLSRAFGVDVPWHYRTNRCGRTVTALPQDETFGYPERVGTHHNAVDDAIYQANLVRNALRALGVRE